MAQAFGYINDQRQQHGKAKHSDQKADHVSNWAQVKHSRSVGPTRVHCQYREW